MDRTLDLGSLIGILLRQGRLIFLVLAAVMALTLLLLLTFRPIYTATALVLVDTSHKDLLSASDQGDNGGLDSARVDSEVELVKSQATLLNVIKQADLLEEPEFAPQIGLTDRLRVALHLGEPASATGEQALRNVLDELDGAVSADRLGTTFLIEINGQTGNPALSAKLANTVADAYIADQRQAKVDSILAARDIIQSRLPGANTAVADSEEAIDNFIEANFATIAQSTGRTDLNGMRDQLQQLQNDQTTAAAKVDEVAKGIAAADWTKVAASLQSDAVNALVQQRQDLGQKLASLTANAASTNNLQSELERIGAQLVNQAKAGLSSLKDRLAADKAQSSDLKGQLRSAAISSDMPAALLTNLYGLQQNSQIARAQYQALIARQKDLETQAFLQVADSRLVSPAIAPTQPSAPNSRLILTLGALAGLALGAGAALLRENLVGGFTSRAQVQSLLRTPAVSTVPWQRPLHDDKQNAVSFADLMAIEPLSAYAESIRTIQVGVVQALRRRRKLADGSAGPSGAVLLVSSANPSEGKTTVALSLARAFVASGRTTLLIDGDLRLPSLHQHLRLEPSVGLIEYLRRGSDGPRIEDIMTGDPVSDLRVIVGSHPSDLPTDWLITNQSLNNLLGAARRHFQIIIVDTPPITPVVDGLYLAEHADIVVFVLKWAKTSQQIARNAVFSLRESLPDDAPIISVMNQYRSGRARGADYHEPTYS